MGNGNAAATDGRTKEGTGRAGFGSWKQARARGIRSPKLVYLEAVVKDTLRHDFKYISLGYGRRACPSMWVAMRMPAEFRLEHSRGNGRSLYESSRLPTIPTHRFLFVLLNLICVKINLIQIN